MTEYFRNPEVLTIGETMVLFQTIGNGKIQYSNTLGKTMAGAESNVAIGLTRLGKNTAFVSRLGMDPFGDYISSTLRGEGVDIRFLERDPNQPTGVMFKEIQGAMDPNVYYYRKNSAASQWSEKELRRDLFEGIKVFHFTGITPALSKECENIILKACELAKKSGSIVSFDPNMRYKLWSETKARETFLELIKLSNIVLPGIEEAQLITQESDIDTMAESLLGMGPTQVIIKMGSKGAVGFQKLIDGTITKVSEHGFPVENVIDTVGAGDGFAAGYLSGYLDDLSLSDCLIRANAVGALVTQYRGDWEGLPRLEELNNFIEGKSTLTR